MGDYLDGKKGRIIVPVPGRPIHPVAETKEDKSKDIDVNAIAAAVVKAIGGKISVVKSHQEEEMSQAEFEASSLERLADAMVMQRDKSESNFEDLGNIKKTKKDSKETDKTIDLLKNLGD